MPNFNSEKHLEESIRAFLAQEYENKRLIIVDGKSTDSSHKIIQKYRDDHSTIEWIKKEDKGISDAINIGLSQINDDEIFGFLGADDILLEDTFQKVSDFLTKNPEAIGVFFDSYSQNAKGERKHRVCPSETMTMDALLKYRTIAGLQNIYLRAETVKRYQFNNLARFSMDYELYLRLAKDNLGERFFHISHPSTININDGNISTQHRRASKREALKFAYDIAPFSWRKVRIGLRLLR